MPKAGIRDNQQVEVHGQSFPLADACRLYNVTPQMVRDRMKHGLALLDALSLAKYTPMRPPVACVERGTMHPMLQIVAHTKKAGTKVKCLRCGATSVRAKGRMHAACKRCRHYVEYKGKWWSVKELAAAHDATHSAVSARLRRGFSVAEALLPVGVRLGKKYISVSELGRLAGMTCMSAKARLSRGETPASIVATGKRNRLPHNVGDVVHGQRILACVPGQEYKVQCVSCKAKKTVRVGNLKPGCDSCRRYKQSLKLDIHGQVLTLREAAQLYDVPYLSISARAKARGCSLVDALLSIQPVPKLRKNVHER